MIGRRSEKKLKAKLHNQSDFLARLSVLIKEGYTFSDGLKLLLPHHMKDYKLMLTDIEEDFRNGLNVSHILSRIGFSANALLPIAIAEKDGRLSEALEGMAIRLEKTEAAKKKLKGLLAYPSVLFIFISILLVGFRSFFLPNMEALSVSRSEDGGIASALPVLVTKVPDFIIGTGIGLLLISLVGRFIYQRLSPPKKIRVFTSLPIVANLVIMWKTRVFAGEIGGLLGSGLSMQDALDILIQQNLDPVLGEMSRNVKEHVIYGEPFHMAVGLTDGLTKELGTFAEHGSHSGHLSKELVIYSEYLDDAINQQISKGLAVLQPFLFSLIAVCILAAYIALLLPVYGMLDKI